MVKYYLYDAYGDVFMAEVNEKERKIDHDEQYVELADYKKLQELFLNLHGYVSFHCGSKETNVYLNQYKKLVGEK